MSEIRTIVRSSVCRLGKVTLSVSNYGRFYIRLENRTNDTEYEISPTKVPLWLKELDKGYPV